MFQKSDWEHFDSLTCDELIVADVNEVAAPVLKHNLPPCLCRRRRRRRRRRPPPRPRHRPRSPRPRRHRYRRRRC